MANEGEKESEDVCPKCGSFDVKFNPFEIVDNQGYYPAECCQCLTTFQQWYKIEFIEIREIYTPKKNKHE